MIYKGIGFDYGGVISGRPRSFFHKEVAKLFNVSEEQFLIAYYLYNKKVNNGEITRKILWELVAHELGQVDKASEAHTLSLSFLNEPINKAVLNLIDKLRLSGYKVGLLSNNDLEGGQKMRELGIDKHFDVFHNSAETKLVKPDPAAFIHFANELNTQPSQLIFIDDTEKSLSSAEECGFTPLLFKSYEQLLRDLEKLHIQ